jgi:PKD repeat protein
VDDASGSRGSYYLHLPPEDLPGAPPRPAAPPSAAFLALVEGLVVEVDASFAQAAPGETLTSYEWDWGDGSRGEGVVAKHTYSHYGAFEIRLTVRDSSGQVGEATRGIFVEEDSKPSATQKPTSTTSAPRPQPAAPPTSVAPPPPATDPGVRIEIPAGPAALALLVLLGGASALRRR